MFWGNMYTSNPLGPCMVSNEGTCSNYYKYRRDEQMDFIQLSHGSGERKLIN